MKILEKLIEKLEKLQKLLRTSKRVDELEGDLIFLRANYHVTHAKLLEVEKRIK